MRFHPWNTLKHIVHYGDLKGGVLSEFDDMFVDLQRLSEEVTRTGKLGALDNPKGYERKDRS